MIIAAGAGKADFSYTSNTGHDYKPACNSNGYVLTPIAPVSRYLGQGAQTHIQRQTEVIYLVQSCDVYSELLGNGQWCWANGGVSILPILGLVFPVRSYFAQHRKLLRVIAAADDARQAGLRWNALTLKWFSF